MFVSPQVPSPQELTELAQQFSELDIPSIEACLAFLNTTSVVYAALDTHLARHQLSMGKFTVLMQLFRTKGQGLTPSECAERSGVTRGTITGLLDGLEKDGLVKRQPHPVDRRRLIVELTSQGQQKLTQMLPEHFCRTTEMMAHLNSDEKKTLIELLFKLQVGIPAMRDI
ncbi:MAG: MarR family winged helix-turn-helix transcriptional regulator [Aulosira sp. ZfuVER01]|nr:MarR family transcriptional regulator [Aulosira sp. ZfuVER01]MDZ8000191.1 MarR family transcriptional regulator [Aulosira sp. DedVER01a]MDZ8053441.1 MarR family transcriptional regulator [Aulosira sp. ZfuCHP01]